jgi:hypothetical protein
MNGALSLRGHDALCRSVLGTKLPFPVTEIFADAEFLIGGNRPTPDLHRLPAKGNCAATTDVPILQMYIANRLKVAVRNRIGSGVIPLPIRFHTQLL